MAKWKQCRRKHRRQPWRICSRPWLGHL
jgi:hypothetical protein